MYQDTLKNQWENLCADFAKNFDLIITKGNIPDCLNEWYKARAYRWRSITYSEGVILEQNTSPEFAEKLVELIEDFRFKYIEPAQKKSFLPKIALSAALGVVVAVVSKFYFYDALNAAGNWLKPCLTGAALFVVFDVWAYRHVSNFNQDNDKQIKSGYIDQLKNFYQKHLLTFCESYESKDKQ